MSSTAAAPPGISSRNEMLALIAGAVLIGLAPIFVRLTDVGYTAVGFWRAALSLPLLAPLMLRGGTPGLNAFSTRGIAPLLLAGVFFAGDLGIWHQSIRLTSVANATLMANLAPVFVTLASFLLFGERFRAGFIGGLALAVTGAVVLVSARLKPGSLVGDGCGVVAAIFYAAYLLSVARARSRFGTVQLMFWTSAATAGVLLAASLALGETLLPQSLHGWMVLAGLALLSHVLGQGLIAYALAHLPAALSAVGLLVQPVAAALFAWMLLAEPFGPRQALGGVIVLAGILVCRLATPKPVSDEA